MKFTISFAAISALALAVSAAPMPSPEATQVNAAFVAPVPATVQGKTTTTTTTPVAQLNVDNKDGLLKRIGKQIDNNKGKLGALGAAIYLGSTAYQKYEGLKLKQAAVHPFATEKTRERLFKEAELKARIEDAALLRKYNALEQDPEAIIYEILSLQNVLGKDRFPALAQISKNCKSFEAFQKNIAAQLEKAISAASTYEKQVDPSVNQDQKISNEDFEKLKKNLAERLTIVLEARDIGLNLYDIKDTGYHAIVEYAIEHHDTLNGKAFTPKDLKKMHKKYLAERKKAEAKANKEEEAA